jgi:uncharacterized membrane protein HdeD (DUF308 family)
MNVIAQKRSGDPPRQEVTGIRKNWGWFLALGIVQVIAGTLAAGFAFSSTLASVVTLGVLLLIAAGAQIAAALLARDWDGFFLFLLLAILYAVAGFLTLRHPLLAAEGLALMLAALFLVVGLFRIAVALIDQLPSWGLRLFNGIVTMLLGLAIWRQWPASGLWVVGMSVGIELIVNGVTWPVLPMRRLRASIAAALQDTAVSLGRLFDGPRSGWEGSPPTLGETVTRARDLLDDARYLPSPDHVDPACNGILGCLQEIDANLEYVRFLVGLEEEHPLRQHFFRVIGDYAEQARSNLEQVARQFQPSPGRAARVEPVHWEPDASGRWASASHDVGPVPDREIDPWRPAVIARCLDQIALAVERISGIARAINLRNSGR